MKRFDSKTNHPFFYQFLSIFYPYKTGGWNIIWNKIRVKLTQMTVQQGWWNELLRFKKTNPICEVSVCWWNGVAVSGILDQMVEHHGEEPRAWFWAADDDLLPPVSCHLVANLGILGQITSQFLTIMFGGCWWGLHLSRFLQWSGILLAVLI